MLADQARHLRPRQPGGLAQEPPQQPLVAPDPAARSRTSPASAARSRCANDCRLPRSPAPRCPRRRRAPVPSSPAARWPMSRLSSDDPEIGPSRLISRWNRPPRSGSFVVGQDDAYRSCRGACTMEHRAGHQNPLEPRVDRVTIALSIGDVLTAEYLACGRRAAWADHLAAEFDKPYMGELRQRLVREERRQRRILPQPHRIFKALDETTGISAKGRRVDRVGPPRAAWEGWGDATLRGFRMARAAMSFP